MFKKTRKKRVDERVDGEVDSMKYAVRSMELEFLSYEEKEERVEWVRERLKEQICGLGFMNYDEYKFRYAGPKDEYYTCMEFKIDDDKLVSIYFGIMKHEGLYREVITFNYEFWSVLGEVILESLAFGKYMVVNLSSLSEDGYPCYYFTEGFYEVDEKDFETDEFGKKFSRLNEDILEYLARLKEYQDMMAMMG